DASERARYQFFGVQEGGPPQVPDNAVGSVVGAPCFDPWQTVVPDRVLARVIGVLVVRGNISQKQIVANADLRYVIEQYAKAAASLLSPQPRDLNDFMANASASRGAQALQRDPEDALGLGDSKEFQPYQDRP